MSKYTNSAQQRILRLVITLFGDVVAGYPPGVLAKAVGAAPSAITRDLANLAEAGLAERLEDTGCWRLTPRLPQQAVKVWSAIQSHERRLDEAKQRFSRNPD